MTIFLIVGSIKLKNSEEYDTFIALKHLNVKMGGLAFLEDYLEQTKHFVLKTSDCILNITNCYQFYPS